MSEELPKTYNPPEIERKWYGRWLAAGCFTADAHSEKPGYSIVIPPPNVTGVLHLGHVLNNTLQDILARRARQEGKEVLWLPGTDHAGIATQTQVEKQLRKDEGKTRRDIGREAFLQRAWAWKEQYGGTIIKQLKRLGCSCDWSRERFTMDADYTKSVQEVFVKLFNKGLMYRGLRMVNWCPSSLTALSDEEVIMKPQNGKLYTMRYEIVERPGEYLTISTTRPETLMGDTAVAVNPKDPRWQALIGQQAWRPFPRAAIPIIGDESVDLEFGTGCLKVTPAHDKVDFEIGQRHQLPAIDVLHPDGRINCPACPELDGLDRFEARKKSVLMLTELGLLIKEEPYSNNVGYSERANVPIEPRLSLQWFLRYPQVEAASRVVESDEVRIRPDHWKKTYKHWMENLKDWCISRQLWWGHRIPVWYRREKMTELLAAETLDISHLESGDLHVGTEPPTDAGNWVQDEDSMDTWFSSWLWPFATMDAATKAKFYPTNDLVTGPDILFFWVARMIMAGLEFEGQIPFHKVYLTGLIRDKQGRKLSKTLNNSPDCTILMDKFGADGVRFGLIRLAPTGGDIRYDEDQVAEGRNFATKLWNATRFRQMHGGASPSLAELGGAATLPIYQMDILAKLDALAESVKQALADYEFSSYAAHLYQFFWSEYCDWFLEAVKGDLREGAEPKRRQQTLAVMDLCLSRYLQLLHPLMPHLTEELWATLGYGAKDFFLMQLPLPVKPALEGVELAVIATARERTEKVYTAVSRARNLKAEYNLAANRNVTFILKPTVVWALQESSTFAQLAGAKELLVQIDYASAQGTPTALTDLGELLMPLVGLVDMEAERSRLDKEIEKVQDEVKKCATKIVNFGERTPPAVVNKERARQTEWETKLATLQTMRAALGI